MRIALTLLLLFCASAANAADKVKPELEQYQHFLELLNDDDWLTGVWSGGSKLASYTLYEKTADVYSVKYYNPRYYVSWWTGKVEKQDDKVLSWDYNIVDGKLQLPDKPTDTEIYKDGILCSTNTSPDDKKNQIADLNQLKWLAKEEFISGESELKAELKNFIFHKKTIPHYELILRSNSLQDKEKIRDIKILNSKKSKLNEFYLYSISIAYYLPGSQRCGGSSEDGYYWVHFQNRDGAWKIQDDWLSTANTCTDEKAVLLDEEGETRNTITLYWYEGNNEHVLECFEFNPKDISEKPKPFETEKPAAPKN